MYGLLLLLFLASVTKSAWSNFGCYINLDLESCQSKGVESVRIEISPFGTKREYVIEEMHPHICHPMKCIKGTHVGRSVSITVKAILGGGDRLKLATQPAIFNNGDAFYTNIESCHHGHANVKVMCKSALQAGFYSLGDNEDSFPLECGSNEALYPVSKQFDYEMKEQKWEFQCKTSMKLSHSSCQWSEKVNSWNGNAFYQCPLNSVITGVKTYYDSENEQPHFQFKCCSTPNYFTTGCKLTEPNEYPTEEDTLVGAFVPSKDTRNEEDWQFLICNYNSKQLWNELYQG